MDPFVAEIRIVGFNFAPKGWAYCNGQLLPISQNTALFALIGTFYGGDGKSTFALPNMQGSSPIGAGQGPGLSDYFVGQEGGSSSVTLISSEMPAHNHTVRAAAFPASATLANTGHAIARSAGGSAYAPAATAQAVMAPQAIQVAGGTQPHNNMMPYLALNFVIALQGVFPPRP
jgi:microcystin-dependent protein